MGKLRPKCCLQPAGQQDALRPPQLMIGPAPSTFFLPRPSQVGICNCCRVQGLRYRVSPYHQPVAFTHTIPVASLSESTLRLDNACRLHHHSTFNLCRQAVPLQCSSHPHWLLLPLASVTARHQQAVRRQRARDLTPLTDFRRHQIGSP